MYPQEPEGFHPRSFLPLSLPLPLALSLVFNSPEDHEHHEDRPGEDYNEPMHLEGITLAAVVSELRERALGALVQQVYKPLPELVILQLYRPKTKEKLQLLLSTDSEARAHLTEQRYENPLEAPAFCMLLRKHLKGGVLERVEQPDLERLVDLVIARRGEAHTLRAELLGSRSNVVLLRGHEILGALKSTVGSRLFRPHQRYEPPPAQGKLDPRRCSPEEWLSRLGDRPEDALQKGIAASTAGIGPRTARELCLRAGLPPEAPVSSLGPEQRERLWGEVERLFRRVAQGDFEPCVYYDEEGTPVDVTPFPYAIYEHRRCERFSRISEALDACSCSPPLEPFERLHRALRRELARRLEKVEGALKNVARDVEQAERHREYQELGDLLMARLSELGGHRGRASVELTDFAGQARVVALDPRLTPLENAQRYYERAKKLRRGLEKLAGRRRELEWERQYLEEMQLHLEEARSPDELRELAEELGLAEGPPKRGRRPDGASRPRRYELAGYGIWVGRSGRQNDLLIRESHREDWWLHVQDRPGAHVVVRGPKKGEEPPSEVLQKAAELAAYYSKGRGSGKVPVIATRIKYLRKPKGARPGLVLVTRVEKTLFVRPQTPFQLSAKGKTREDRGESR